MVWVDKLILLVRVEFLVVAEVGRGGEDESSRRIVLQLLNKVAEKIRVDKLLLATVELIVVVEMGQLGEDKGNREIELQLAEEMIWVDKLLPVRPRLEETRADKRLLARVEFIVVAEVELGGEDEGSRRIVLQLLNKVAEKIRVDKLLLASVELIVVVEVGQQGEGEGNREIEPQLAEEMVWVDKLLLARPRVEETRGDKRLLARVEFIVMAEVEQGGEDEGSRRVELQLVNMVVKETRVDKLLQARVDKLIQLTRVEFIAVAEKWGWEDNSKHGQLEHHLVLFPDLVAIYVVLIVTIFIQYLIFPHSKDRNHSVKMSFNSVV